MRPPIGNSRQFERNTYKFHFSETLVLRGLRSQGPFCSMIFAVDLVGRPVQLLVLLAAIENASVSEDAK